MALRRLGTDQCFEARFARPPTRLAFSNALGPARIGNIIDGLSLVRTSPRLSASRSHGNASGPGPNSKLAAAASGTRTSLALPRPRPSGTKSPLSGEDMRPHHRCCPFTIPSFDRLDKLEVVGGAASQVVGGVPAKRLHDKRGLKQRGEQPR